MRTCFFDSRLFGSNLLGTAILLLSASAAQAHGTIALGGTAAETAAKGIAVGISTNFATVAEADAAALEQCEKQRAALNSSGLPQCNIIARFQHQFAIVAMDPKEATPGFGWSMDSVKSVAERNAMFECRESSPADRKDFCQVMLSYEDNKP